MAIFRILDHVFGSFDLAIRYSHLLSMDDADLAARGLSRETIARTYLDDLAARDTAAAPHDPQGDLHAPA